MTYRLRIFLPLVIAPILGVCLSAQVFGQTNSQANSQTNSQANSQSRTRLARPSEANSSIPVPNLPVPSSLPVDGRPFSLGVQEKHLGPAILNGTINVAPPLSGALSTGGALKNQSGIFDQVPSNMFSAKDTRTVLQGNANSQKLSAGAMSVQLLANYDLELIVDASLSMRRRDCPGGLSRWEWCGNQTTDLVRRLTPFAPKGLTLTSFASEFQVYPNSSTADIANLFNNPAFMWGTHLAEPLDDRLKAFLARRKPGSKPMLLAVITDGVPAPRYEPQMVVDTLVATTKQLRHPNEVTVVFFQIGASEYRGARFLNELDNGLVSYGAKYDIVRTFSFDQLQKLGLAKALVQSIQDFTATSK